MRQIVLAYNPISGDRTIVAMLDRIVAAFQHRHFCVTLFRISGEHKFSLLADVVADTNAEYVVIAGGDGTINRVVNLLQSRNLETPIAIIPTGTANDFARTIGMPTDTMRAVKAILGGRLAKIDLGRVGEKYFVNILSCGLMCDISQRTPTAMKNTLGKVAYYFSSISELPNFRKIDISVESRELTFGGQCLLVMVFNGRSAGNFEMAMRSSITDGELDVIIVRGQNVVNTIRALFHFLLKREGNYPDDVVYFRTNRLRINIAQSDVATDIDGEEGGSFPMEVECLPGRLSVICPLNNGESVV